ncbi:hypothetical protein SODG_007269 [Sodalis praecaptivus]
MSLARFRRHLAVQAHGLRREQPGVHRFKLGGDTGAKTHLLQNIALEIDTRRDFR